MTHFKTILCYLLAAFFFFAGIAHFTQDDAFASIVPPMLPFPYLIVWVTGILEFIFAAGLIFKRFRRQSGFWLAPYLLAVLPANIYMAIANIPLGDMEEASPTALWVRVVLQFPLIALILWASGNFDKRSEA